MSTAPVFCMARLTTSSSRIFARGGKRRLVSPFRSLTKPSSDIVIPATTLPMRARSFRLGAPGPSEEDLGVLPLIRAVGRLFARGVGLHGRRQVTQSCEARL